MLTIEELLNGIDVKVPLTPTDSTEFKKAEKIDKESPKQWELEI